MKTELQKIVEAECAKILSERGPESSLYVARYLTTFFELLAKGKSEELRIAVEVSGRLVLAINKDIQSHD